MKPLYSRNEWQPIAVYDLEAGSQWVDINLACHVDEYGNRLFFRSVADYVTWLFAHFPGTIVFAHFGGHYDHRFLLAECHKRGYQFTTANSGGSMVVLTINDGKREIHFADSYRLMPSSLAAIGKTVGLEKIDLDPSKFIETPFEKTLEYCFRDCDIVMEGLMLMRKHLVAAGADFGFTLASTAARYIRRNSGIDFKEFVYHNGKKWVPREHVAEWDGACYMAYHGGRTEMLMKGIFRKPLYWYDIVSSYPSSMREPLPLYYRGWKPPPKTLNKRTIKEYLSHMGITKCTVYVPTGQQMTVLPIKDDNHRLIFPDGGPFTGSWTNIELQEAVKQGAEIREIHGQYRFKGVAFLRKFVDTFYGLRMEARKEKDAFKTYAYKILLNSSYGKTTETVDRKSFISIGEFPRYLRKIAEIVSEKRGCSYEEAFKNGYTDSLNNIEASNTAGVYYACTQEVGPMRHTAVGAYITAYSRLKLFRMAKKMLDRGATVYYCDTDSLILDMPIPENETGHNLGDWEYVDTLSELELVLPKVYRAVSATGKPTVYKCKGCPIVRKWESPDMPEKRWRAFLTHRSTQDPADLIILGRDGVTGIATDIKEGTLMPQRLHAKCATCRVRDEKKHFVSTGTVNGAPCPKCLGTGRILKPLARTLQSDDKKRHWLGERSIPITLPAAA